MPSNNDPSPDSVTARRNTPVSNRSRRKTPWGAGALLAIVATGWFIQTQTNWVRRFRADRLDLTWTPHDLPMEEPSAVAYHPGRQTLFVVSDEGYFQEFTTDLKPLARFDLPADLEGITVHPTTGTIFISSEIPWAIYEFDPDLARIIRTMDVDLNAHPDFHDKTTHDRNGLEGVTIVTKPGQVSRLFAVVEGQPARLIELDADLSPGATDRARSADPAALFGLRQRIGVRTSMDLGVPLLSDLAYDERSDQFLIVSSEGAILWIADVSGMVRRSVRLPGTEPEGLALLPDGRAILTDDAGGVRIAPGFAEKLFKPLSP
jgi:uncharacterized protein YjiK